MRAVAPLGSTITRSRTVEPPSLGVESGAEFLASSIRSDTGVEVQLMPVPKAGGLGGGVTSGVAASADPMRPCCSGGVCATIVHSKECKEKKPARIIRHFHSVAFSLSRITSFDTQLTPRLLMCEIGLGCYLTSPTVLGRCRNDACYPQRPKVFSAKR